jgi:diguanylate cyclase (GGDEF)-like protein/PAS domain S-box-containing protein
VAAIADNLFDDLTARAGQTLATPIAALSLAEQGHHWFKSRGGVSAADTPLALALCRETILARNAFVLPDVALDPRFSPGTHPGAAIRFFAGVPLINHRGVILGTLSVMDSVPRVVEEGQLEAFRQLGRDAGRLFDLRLGVDPVAGPAGSAAPPFPAGASEPEFRRLVEESAVGTYVIQNERYSYVNPRLAELLGYSEAELAALPSVGELVAEGDRAAVLRRVRAVLEGAAPTGPSSFRMIRKDGEQIDVEVHESAAESHGQPAVIGTLLDISERRRSETHMVERAFIDALTKLPNRARFMERLELELAQSRRHDRKLAIVSLNVDGFKFVNDNWGHAIGDRLLQSLALRLTRAMREVDVIARVGADEFLVLIPDLRQSQDMSRVAQKLLSLTARPFELDGLTLEITASVGVATYPDDGQDAEPLLRNADAAMDRAKQVGRNNFQLCTPELTATAMERLELQNGMRIALDRNEFCLHYQPLVSLHTGRIVGLEALVRWQHAEKGLVMPAAFISIAEETGLILPLGGWVLRTACGQLKMWHGTGLDLRMAVNFSAHQFRERNLVHTVERALSDAGLEPRHLEVEITESIAMEGAEIVVANLSMLRSMGVGIAIDDFGTGYSSMSYLKRYPITSLKIDRSFVTDLAANPADAGIVRAIVEMAHGSNLSVIAEGVETKEQFVHLQKYGCDEMQGYWVSPPMPEDGVERRLADEVTLWKQAGADRSTS